ncbi:hypothetical protein TNIN_185921 [Trichonephila inaurata madagascariensis]|uniref:Uncharacterized protein n=1 Tax=Trichonephila inaurata madagascariensis TaxID=2747483 RepID=A0A8X6X560_9ARAC|nr:hypothetical protein TNIN_110681 [Trichonephila inaurata madagascariensis]GFY63059.1 hypothetical protein TNIN_185921 [Trichonephila inaurata madagascariensis]
MSSRKPSRDNNLNTKFQCSDLSQSLQIKQRRCLEVSAGHKTIFRHSLFLLSSESGNWCFLDMTNNFLVPSTEDKPP